MLCIFINTKYNTKVFLFIMYTIFKNTNKIYLHIQKIGVSEILGILIIIIFFRKYVLNLSILLVYIHLHCYKTLKKN